MKLQPLTPELAADIKSRGYNPDNYVFDAESGKAEHRSKIARLAPADLQNQLGFNPYDAAVMAKRGPITSALSEGLNRMGAGGFGALATITGSDTLDVMRANMQNTAEYLASKRQPGKLDTALGIGAGLATQVPMYVYSFPAAVGINAFTSAGEGAQRTAEAGGSGGAQALNALIRGGSSALTDIAGQRLAQPLATQLMKSTLPAVSKAGALTIPALLGGVENATAQFGMNVADRVTFNPNKDLSEGTGQAAILGSALPLGVGAGKNMLANRAASASSPVASMRAERERLNMMPFAERQAALAKYNEQFAGQLKKPLELTDLGGLEGDRMDDASITSVMNLAKQTGQAAPLAGANQKLLADAVNAGLEPSVDEARQILNHGRAALDRLQVARAGTLAETKAVATREEARAAEEAALEERVTKAASEVAAGRDAEDALRAAYDLPPEFIFNAVDTKGKVAEAKAWEAKRAGVNKAAAAGLRSIAEGKTPMDPSSPLAQLAPGGNSITAQPNRAENTLIAAREVAEADKMNKAAEASAVEEAAKRAMQTAQTIVPQAESVVSAKLAAPVNTPAKPEDATTLKNASTAATTAPTVPDATGKGLGAVNSATVQKGTGPTEVTAKTKPAQPSVPMQPSEASTTSALRPPEGVSKNPSPAEVVASGQPKLSLIDQIKQSYRKAVDTGDTKNAKELATLLRNKGVPVPDNADAPPPRPMTSAINTPERAALPGELQALGDEASAINIQAMRLEMAGKTAEADQLRADFAAKRAAVTSALPKDKVAAPVATVEAQPAIKAESVAIQAPKLTDAEKAEIQAELTGKPAKPVKPPKLKIVKAQSSDADTLKAAGLTVRRGKRGNWEIYNKDIDEVTRDLGGMADEAEAIGEAARIMREESGQGIGSKMRKSRQSEAGFFINPATIIAEGTKKAYAGLRSETNKLLDYADKTGNTVARHAYERITEWANAATTGANKLHNESNQIWNKLSRAERAELTDILQYEKAARQEWDGKMSPRVEQAYLEQRGQFREWGERAAREGPRIQEGDEWRPLIVDRFWTPEVVNGKVMNELYDVTVDPKTGMSPRQKRIEEFRTWAARNGLSADQIDTEVKRFDISTKEADADLEFDALHKPMTVPLPPGWAGNTQDAINRYITKYSFEMERHRLIDQDPVLGPMSRGQRESLDGLGRVQPRLPEAGKVGDDVDSMFRSALDSFAVQLNPGRQSRIQRAAGVVHPMRVQTRATSRDLINAIMSAPADAGVVNSMKGLVEGITKYDELKNRGLVRDTGNLSGDIQRLAESRQNGQFIEAWREVLRAGQRLGGVDLLNKFQSAVLSSAGISRAKEAILNQDDAFFKRVGLPDWRAREPEYVENHVARWVMEGAQSSMGALDNPTHMIKSSGVGAKFFPILRWSFGFTNQQINRAFKPLMDSSLSPRERVMPLATRLVGAKGASIVAKALLGTLFGAEDREPTMKEWQVAGYPNKLKYLLQKMTELQIAPAVTAFANVMVGNQQMPRNMTIEFLPAMGERIASLIENFGTRKWTDDDAAKAVDSLMDEMLSNWRDVSKVAGGETKDEIEQARARYDNMQTMKRSTMKADPLNLNTQFNRAKTIEEVNALADKIVNTATLDTPDVMVKGPSEDLAFALWLKETNPELSARYDEENYNKATELDPVYREKKAVADRVNARLKLIKEDLSNKSSNPLEKAKAYKVDWEASGPAGYGVRPK